MTEVDKVNGLSINMQPCIPSERFPVVDVQGLDLLVLVSQRQAQLFHHRTQSQIQTVLSGSAFLTHSFSASLSQTPTPLSIRHTPAASSPGWLHRRRLASQGSKFTAVDADVIRSNRHLLFLLLPPHPPPPPNTHSQGPSKSY